MPWQAAAITLMNCGVMLLDGITSKIIVMCTPLNLALMTSMRDINCYIYHSMHC